MKELTLKAMAKVNLGLDVLRKREDGYHDLRMVMQSVYLYDKIRMTVKAEPGIVLRTNLRYLPTGADNLVCRAAQPVSYTHLDVYKRQMEIQTEIWSAWTLSVSA